MMFFAPLLWTVAIAAEPACVALDAGHGGADTGTTVLAYKEKNLSLQITKKTMQHLRQALPDTEIVLTREDDRDVPLAERARLANERHCRAFVSLHINSSFDENLNGVETYYLDTLKNRLSLRLAEIAGRKSPLAEPALIAKELELKNLTLASGELAVRVQRQVLARARAIDPAVRSNGARHDLFQLLMSVDMPAIIVETGYLSNAAEREHLADEKYQHAIAAGIAAGVRDFLAAH